MADPIPQEQEYLVQLAVASIAIDKVDAYQATAPTTEAELAEYRYAPARWP